jgi:hypothetical protein
MKLLHGIFAVGLLLASFSAKAELWCFDNPPIKGTSTVGDTSLVTVIDGGGTVCIGLGNDSPTVGGGPGGGGGGGVSDLNPNNLVDQAISAKLKCAFENYLHNNAKLGTDSTGTERTMKKVDAWAFGKQNINGDWDYKFRSTNVLPGTGWTYIGGLAVSGTTYGRLYNGAFLAYPNFDIDGTPPSKNELPNSLSGAITSLEMSLFIGGHEASHLFGVTDEKKADWYGIYAVLKYRSDGGAKCAGL